MAKKEFACSGCGASVLKHLSQLTRTDIVFCTLKCRNSNYSKIVPEYKPANFKGPKEHKCIGCDTVFRVDRDRPQNREYCSQSCSAQHRPRPAHSLETKNKISAAAAKQNARYKREFLYVRDSKSIQMRSSWEVKYATWLDNQQVGWEYEPTFILSSGHTYVPDFKLSDGSIVEIKGYFRPDAKLKWDMFCSEYPELSKQLLMKTDLQKLKII